jgi:hypothetical protein
MVEVGGPDVTDGISDRGVDGEGNVTETNTIGSDHDGVNGTGTSGLGHAVAIHCHSAWWSTELSHAF